MINGLSAVTDAPPAYPPASLAIPEFNAPTDCTRGGLIVRSRWEIVSILRPNEDQFPSSSNSILEIIVYYHFPTRLNLNLVHIRLSQSWFTIRGSITSLKRDTRGIERIKSLSIRIKSKLSKRSAKSGAGKGDRSRGILETNRVALVTRGEEIKRGRQKVSFMTFTR